MWDNLKQSLEKVGKGKSLIAELLGMQHITLWACFSSNSTPKKRKSDNSTSSGDEDNGKRRRV